MMTKPERSWSLWSSPKLLPPLLLSSSSSSPLAVSASFTKSQRTTTKSPTPLNLDLFGSALSWSVDCRLSANTNAAASSANSAAAVPAFQAA